MSVAARPVVLVFLGNYLPGFKAGGILTCVVNLVNHLHREFEFLIVTRDRDLGDVMPYPNIKIHQWQAVGNARVYYMAADAESLGNVRRIIEETPHDVIYLNSFFDPLTIKVLLNKKLGRLAHSPIILTPQGEFAWASLKQKYAKKALFMRLARVIGLYAPVTWHASGTAEAQDIMKVMGIRRQFIHVALQLPPMMPPISEDGTVDASIAESAGHINGIRLVFLSRIAPEKNLDFALKAMSRVRSNATLDIIGPIENVAYWNQCQRILRELPPHVTVRALGPIQPSEVMKTLSRYDLLLFPSGGESYGQVIAESLISGTQVLISTNTPWRDLEAKGLGWDLPLDDIGSFVRVIDEVGSASEKARSQRRKTVKENVRQFLSDSSAVSDIRQLFNTAIAYQLS